MGTPITTGIDVNGPYPADNKTIVGPGRRYTTRSLILNDYRYLGMRVLDMNDHIEYELVPFENSFGNQGGGSIPDLLTGALTPCSWKNISFGATPFFYDSSNMWLNAESNNFSVTKGTNIIFTAITFGDISKVEWLNNGVFLSNKETININVTADQYYITLKVYDKYGNFETSEIHTISTEAAGILSIREFRVEPEVGITNNPLLPNGRTYNFTALLSEELLVTSISSLTITYKAVNSETSTAVPLFSNASLSNGVTLSDGGKSLAINGERFTDLYNKVFNTNMEFTLDILKQDGQHPIKVDTYTSVPKIAINNNPTFTNISYNDNVITTNVKLLSPYDINSSVTGVLKRGNVTLGSFVPNQDNLTFSLVLSYELGYGTNSFIAEFTQIVGNETYTTTTNLKATVEEPTYLADITIIDNYLPTANPISGATVTITKSGISTQYLTDVNGKIAAYLENGLYNITYSKSGFTPSDQLGFQISVLNASVSTQKILLPNVAIQNFNTTTPIAAGTTLSLTYSIYPASIYEYTASIEYNVKNISGDPLYSITKTKANFPDTYKTLFVENAWGNGSEIEMRLTSHYTMDKIATITKKIGELPAYYGAISFNELQDYANTSFATVLSTILTEDYIIPGEPNNSNSIIYTIGNTTNPIVSWQDVFQPTFEGQGWYWIVFPDDQCPQYLWQAPATGGTYYPIEERFITSPISIGNNNYTLYLFRGIDDVSPNMGNPTILLNIKFRTTQF